MINIKTSEKTEDSKSPTIDYKPTKEETKKQKAFINRTLKNAGIYNYNNEYLKIILLSLIATAIQFIFLGGFVYLGYWLVSKVIN